MEIQISINDETSGPYTLEQVQEMLANGDITAEAYAWYEGCEDWITIAEIPGIDETGEEEAATEEADSTEAIEEETEIEEADSTEVIEEEAEIEEADSTEVIEEEAEGDLFVWPEGAEDWSGPHTITKVSEMLAGGELTESDFAAFEGSSEGATIADIPGLAELSTETEEEPSEAEEDEPAEAEEAENQVPVKKLGGIKKGAAKSGFGKSSGFKKGASGFGAKKGVGSAKKGVGTAKKSAVNVAVKGKGKEASATTEESGEDTKPKGKGLRIATGILLILGLGGNLFVGSCAALIDSAAGATEALIEEKADDQINDAEAAMKQAMEDINKKEADGSLTKEEAETARSEMKAAKSEMQQGIKEFEKISEI
ncbi:MAG: DUF4339 domain-containing protein [Opitutales bacterium]|nr:DUF4339 domain-containing protein [Opitutales bacterium]